MFSWRSMAEPHGEAVWIYNSAWEKGKVQEEVECPWRSLWGLEIINQGRGQPFRVLLAHVPTTGSRGGGGAGEELWQPPQVLDKHLPRAACRCSSSGAC